MTRRRTRKIIGRWPLYAALLVAAGWMFAWLNGASVFNSAKSYYKFRAATLSAETLASGASVTLGGIRVGQVTGIQQRGDGAILNLEILKKYGPIPANSTFGVRTRTVVGENYVAVYPGNGSRMLASNGLLGPSQDDESVDLDQILSTLQGDTRARARETIESLGTALGGRGKALNSLTENTAGLLIGSAPLTAVLAQDHDQLASLVDQFGQVAASLGERSAAIRVLASSAQQTFTALGQRDHAVATTLQDLPSTMRQVQLATRVLHSVTNTATPVVVNLAHAVNELNPAVSDLAPASLDGNSVLADLSATAPGLETTMQRVRSLGPAAKTALPQLHDLLCQANPFIQYLDPYAKNFGELFEDMGSSANFYDVSGHAVRLYVTFGQETLDFLNPQLASLIQDGASSGVLGLHYALGYNALPSPNDVAQTPTASTPTSFLTGNQTYPHVNAAC